MTFLFLDIETTGLDAKKDYVLEIAWAFTDEQFTISTPFTTLVDPGPAHWSNMLYALRNADPVVRDMHKESGLASDILSADVDTEFMTITDITIELGDQIKRVREHRPGAIYVAGFSVHFDVYFLRDQWGLDVTKFDSVSHRLLDLSAVKLMFEATGTPYFKAVNSHPHRASYDVLESVKQGESFRNSLTKQVLA